MHNYDEELTHHELDLVINRPAPDFTADFYHKGEMGKTTLSDYRGKWVLLFFYPLDFTFVCPTEIINLSKKSKEFEGLNCQILTASVDSVFSHQAWCKEIGDLNFPMLSDMTKDISILYNVLNDDGVSLRGAFLIDPEGILQSMTINNLCVGRNIEELKRTLEAFQTGELCPVNWRKGSNTLGPA